MKNIFFIVMDTTRRDAFGIYNPSLNTTPNIDKISRSGFVYNNAYSAAPWTLPSHSSLFTGTYPSVHNARQSHVLLDDRLNTIAGQLSRSGYLTAGFSNNPFVSKTFGLDRGFDFFYNLLELRNDCSRFGVYAIYKFLLKKYRYLDDGADVTGKFIYRFINFMSFSDKPLFIFINYMEPHLNYYPVQPYFNRFLLKDVSPRRADKINRNVDVYNAGLLRMSDKDFKILHSLYNGEVAYLDNRINYLIENIKNAVLYENSMFIITSDHGESLGEHNFFGHQLQVYNTTIKIPLVIIPFKKLDTPVYIDTPVTNAALYYTVLKSVGISEFNEKYISCDLLSLKNKSENIFSEYDYPYATLTTYKKFPSETYKKFEKGYTVLIKDDFKLIKSTKGELELFNIRLDPKETKNVADNNPEIVGNFENMIDRFIENYKKYRTTQLKMTPSQKAAFKALGYIQ